MDGSEDLRRTYRETVIVCGAMVASVLIYAVVVEVLRTQRPPGGVIAGANVDLLRYAFYLLAGIEGLAIPFVRRAVEAGPTVRGSILARLRTGALVAASLAEAAAVMGLVLFMLAGRRLDFYLLAGWSLLLQLVHFPRRERWEEAARTAAHRPG
jgi:F0F1-type ATP synthase membrane subunit c/vacuolar-type H+-ATPase subunit K